MAKKRKPSDNPSRMPSKQAKRLTQEYQAGRRPQVRVRPPALLTAIPAILKRRG
jgi:hypothetical protein